VSENCGNCKYARPQFANERQLTCHCHAPEPFNAIVYRLGELIRDCAWSLRQGNNIEEPSENDDLRDDVTEAPHYTIWSEVERDEWCGEWKPKRKRKRR
jgi:hypothetical protein